jgi:hypothetical protein
LGSRRKPPDDPGDRSAVTVDIVTFARAKMTIGVRNDVIVKAPSREVGMRGFNSGVEYSNPDATSIALFERLYCLRGADPRAHAASMSRSTSRTASVTTARSLAEKGGGSSSSATSIGFNRTQEMPPWIAS